MRLFRLTSFALALSRRRENGGSMSGNLSDTVTQYEQNSPRPQINTQRGKGRRMIYAFHSSQPAVCCRPLLNPVSEELVLTSMPSRHPQQSNQAPISVFSIPKYLPVVHSANHSNILRLPIHSQVPLTWPNPSKPPSQAHPPSHPPAASLRPSPSPSAPQYCPKPPDS